MIHVVAIVTAKPGQRNLLLAAFRKVIPLVLGGAGCIEYIAAIDALDGIVNLTECGIRCAMRSHATP